MTRLYIQHNQSRRTLLLKTEGRRPTANAVPSRVDVWAGPVAGPAEIEKTFGTNRSTLGDWQKRAAVIGLLKGERKYVFPLAQFVEGRPTKGMKDVARIIRNPHAAWQWLIQPRPSLGGTPIEQFKAGDIDHVVVAAELDFGSSVKPDPKTAAELALELQPAPPPSV